MEVSRNCWEGAWCRSLVYRYIATVLVAAEILHGRGNTAVRGSLGAAPAILAGAGLGGIE